MNNELVSVDLNCKACLVYEAALLIAEGKYEKALELLEDIPEIIQGVMNQLKKEIDYRDCEERGV